MLHSINGQYVTVYAVVHIQWKMYIFSVEWLIVDESDKLFEEGKRGFRDQVRLKHPSRGWPG